MYLTDVIFLSLFISSFITPIIIHIIDDVLFWKQMKEFNKQMENGLINPYIFTIDRNDKKQNMKG